MRRLSISFMLFPLLFAGLAAAQELTITPNFDGEKWLGTRQPIELRLSRPLLPAEGRLAVFVGSSDLTPLFDVTPERLSYRTNSLPLPSGENQVTVYFVPVEGAWKEIGKFPIRILTRHGFEKSNFKPSLDLTNKGQLENREIPEASFSTRQQFQDLTAQGGIQMEHQRGNFALRTQANVAGVTYRPEALRFGEKGNAAPRVDLSNYKVELQKGFAEVALGHVAFGTHRHLIRDFGSRGAILTLGAGRPVSLLLGALSGTSIVGWDNITGLTETEHRMLGATLRFELVPSRPGALRAELSVMDGSLQPRNDYNGGAIRSAEKSVGEGLHLSFANKSQRIQLDGGVARSRFHPARDEQLEEGLPVTPLQEADRSAIYLDGTFVLVQKPNASISATVNFERVDPLFRSVAAFTQADARRESVGVNGTFGPLTVQLGYVRSEDNLDDIRSILKTKTRNSTANVGLNLAQLFAAKKSAVWIPVVTVSLNHTHQFGAFLPIDSGFSASHVPDQISLSANGGLQWQVNKFRFGYRTSLSDQDNRQPGRERSDFTGGNGTFFLGVSPSDRFDVSLETSLDEQTNKEFAQTDETRRTGVTLSWKIIGDLAIATNYSWTNARNDPRTMEREANEGFLELSSGFRLWRSSEQMNRSRLFMRYTRRDQDSLDLQFGANSNNAAWSVTSGVNVSVY